MSLAPQAHGLRREERWLASSTAGVQLCVTRWLRPAGSPPPLGAVLFCHGYGHYVAAIYDWLAGVLAVRGLACFALEHVGHGKSTGVPAGFVPSFEHLVEDVLSYSAILRARELPAGTPFFLYGESLGGAICQHAALRAPAAFSGLVLFAPMTGLADGVTPPWPIVQLGRLAAWVAPAAALAPVKDVIPFCFRDATLIPAMRADPHRYSGRMRLGTAFQLKGAMEALDACGATLSTPLLLLHGTGDGLTSHVASQRLFDACAARDKSLVLYEGAFHVLWAEPADTRAALLRDVTEWLLDRCVAERRAALAARARAAPPTSGGGGGVSAMLISSVSTRPLGVAPWGPGDPAAESTCFTPATHGHLYTAQKPESTVAPLDAAERAAVLAVTPPRLENDGVVLAAAAAAAVVTA